MTYTGNGLEAWTDDGTAVVTSGGTSAPAAGTSESWSVSVTVAFPAASAAASPPTYFYVADEAAGAAEQEKVLVTSCPGGTGNQTWTVTRGADGTTPAAHASGFTVQQVITGASLRAVQRAGLPVYYATDFGVKADGGVTDNGPILNAAFKQLWNSGNGQGGIIVLPQSGFMAGGNTAVTTSQTIIIPPYCGLVGMGKQKTMLRLAAGANCDLIQFMVSGQAAAPAIATSQAAILGVSVGTLQNCFYGLIRGMTLHGSWNFQAATDYHSCIHAETNPLVTASTSPADPDFDPTNLIQDVEMRYASGDGFFANGRSGTQLGDCLIRYCQGNGATPSFDTLFSNVEIGFNGICGVYMNHGSTSGDGKLYNNGTIAAWVSGTSYTVGTRVTYSGAVYGCIVATSGTTAPPSDTGHWTAITAYTSPQAFGWDLYLDGNCYENRWDIDSQEPTAGSVYIKQAYGVTIEAVSNRPNFDNPVSGIQLGTNPNNYATVTLDGANGCNVRLGYSVLNSACYGARLIGSATRNNVVISGDGTRQAAISSDTVLTGNFVSVDGAVLSTAGGTGVVSQAAATTTSGYTLVNGTGTIVTWTAPADGALHSAIITAVLKVTSNETGGVIAVDFQAPDNTTQTYTLFSGGLTATGGVGGSGYYGWANGGPQLILPVYPGGTVRVYQFSALTAGAAKAWSTIMAV